MKRFFNIIAFFFELVVFLFSKEQARQYEYDIGGGEIEE